MSFSINPTHNFLVDTPVIIEETPSSNDNGTNDVPNNNNGTTESKIESNNFNKGITPTDGSLQVHQVSGALDDFY